VDDKRRQILDAALSIADEDGLDAVSMRSVAARVGVSPMALYPYVGSKAALLDGLVGRLLGELTGASAPRPVPPAGVRPAQRSQDWRVELRTLANRMRALARRHPTAFMLLLSRPSVTPEAAAAVDAVYQGLLEAGVPPRDVPRIERLVSTFVLGFAASEVNGRFAVDDPQLRARRGVDLPAHQALGDVLLEVDWDAEFEADLRDLERLIASLVEAG
jgi:AcrR family transcriptional regulator